METKNEGKVIKMKAKKQEKKEVKGELPPLPEYNPNEYGYKPGQTAPFEGNLILGMLSFLNTVAAQESKVFYEPSGDFDKTIATEKQYISEIGLQAIRMSELIMGGHFKNIDDGVALHQSVLMKAEKPEKDASFQMDTEPVNTPKD